MSRWLWPLLLLLPLAEMSAQDVNAFKESLAKNQQLLRQYQWVETTTISMKGEVKSQVQKSCFYGPDGNVQKQQISAPTDQDEPGGLKGKKIAQKKAEIKAYMQEAVALVKQYVPPDGQRIQAAKDAGNLSLTPVGGGVTLTVRNYLKSGDALNLSLKSGMELQKVTVNTYLDSPEDKVMLDVYYASLSNGVDYPGQIVLKAPAKNIQVVIQNADYRMMAAVAPPAASTPAAGQGAAPSPQQIDALTAPIALYPDALVNQILEASTDVLQLQSFASWMSTNAAVYGTGLQDAANKAGFSQCYVALVPFSQVVQMMTQKLDWTTQLGQAFEANRAAVFDSIQRLRAQAAKAGALVTNQQQTVTTQTTSTGQTVYVVYPTNPQVVYVPTYNPTTVYVVEDNSNDASAAMAFTVGIIIGAAASNNYYYGPYGWYGGGAYNEAWNNSQYRQDNRQDSYSQNSQYRQDTHQTNQTQRQDTHQTNQSTRQSTASTNQSTRQSTASTNQSTRQSSASSAQSTAQTNQSTRQSSASSTQSTAQTNQSTRQSSASSAQGTAPTNQSGASGAQSGRSSAASTSSAGSGQASGQRSGMSSGGFSGGGYQSGSTTRSQSSRGSSSLSSSRGGGGSRSGGSRSGGGGRSR
ncbi:MAG TPA: DUF3300 domain-containing protein [Candidatus Angelobacter sp.]|nr:DUF3300 domain-containing protein [Candidatus Angelobacter sp.]